MSKKRRHPPAFHVPGRKKRRKRWYERGDSDCCCIVGEVFDGPCFVATAAHSGDAAAEPVRTLRAAIVDALAHCRQADGSYHLTNEWHVVVARA